MISCMRTFLYHIYRHSQNLSGREQWARNRHLSATKPDSLPGTALDSLDVAVMSPMPLRLRSWGLSSSDSALPEGSFTSTLTATLYSLLPDLDMLSPRLQYSLRFQGYDNFRRAPMFTFWTSFAPVKLRQVNSWERDRMNPMWTES